MARNQKDFTYDNKLLLKDAGLVAVSAAATVLGSAATAVLDLGAARMDGRVIVDASAIESDTGDELFTVIAQFSNAIGFGSGVFSGAALLLGHSATTLDSAVSAAGRRELHVTNEINGVTYRYMRLFTKVAGTVATGVNFTAFLVADAF